MSILRLHIVDPKPKVQQQMVKPVRTFCGFHTIFLKPVRTFCGFHTTAYISATYNILPAGGRDAGEILKV
jgi:hypothetical protein